jgi:hypothetical protein
LNLSAIRFTGAVNISRLPNSVHIELPRASGNSKPAKHDDSALRIGHAGLQREKSYFMCASMERCRTMPAARNPMSIFRLHEKAEILHVACAISVAWATAMIVKLKRASETVFLATGARTSA